MKKILFAIIIVVSLAQCSQYLNQGKQNELGRRENNARPDQDAPIIVGFESEPIVDEDVMPVPYAYYDYNGDGKTDLIRKEIDGNYYVYKNSPYYGKSMSLRGIYSKVEDDYTKAVETNILSPARSPGFSTSRYQKPDAKILPRK